MDPCQVGWLALPPSGHLQCPGLGVALSTLLQARPQVALARVPSRPRAQPPGLLQQTTETFGFATGCQPPSRELHWEDPAFGCPRYQGAVRGWTRSPDHLPCPWMVPLMSVPSDLCGPSHCTWARLKVLETAPADGFGMLRSDHTGGAVGLWRWHCALGCSGRDSRPARQRGNHREAGAKLCSVLGDPAAKSGTSRGMGTGPSQCG